MNYITIRERASINDFDVVRTHLGNYYSNEIWPRNLLKQSHEQISHNVLVHPKFRWRKDNDLGLTSTGIENFLTAYEILRKFSVYMSINSDFPMNLFAERYNSSTFVARQINR